MIDVLLVQEKVVVTVLLVIEPQNKKLKKILHAIYNMKIVHTFDKNSSHIRVYGKNGSSFYFTSSNPTHLEVSP